MAKKKYESRFRKPAIRTLVKHHGIGGLRPECEAVEETSPRDFGPLVESISRRGLLLPILIDNDGMLVEGRSRLCVCHLLAIEISDGQIAITEESLDSIIERNTPTRNLTRCHYAIKPVQVLIEELDEAKQRRRDGGEKRGQILQNYLS
ncbi:hypothetical protein [Novipirellula sp.]|uniref:hypothetical protein n=1 Tax=Novipirellula sp. TaxID=2795430 RepID=UPI003566177D